MTEKRPHYKLQFRMVPLAVGYNGENSAIRLHFLVRWEHCQNGWFSVLLL